MLSVLIELRDDDAAGLATTLSCLVPAAVDGLVLEVVVLDAGLGPNALLVADHAGCDVRHAPQLADAIAAARGDWLLLLEPGSELLPGWIEAVSRQIVASPPMMTGLGFRVSDWRAWLSRLVRLRRERCLARGLVAPRVALNRRYRIGMRLADLAAAVPARKIDARIRPRDRGSWRR